MKINTRAHWIALGGKIAHPARLYLQKQFRQERKGSDIGDECHVTGLVRDTDKDTVIMALCYAA